MKVCNCFQIEHFVILLAYRSLRANESFLGLANGLMDSFVRQFVKIAKLLENFVVFIFLYYSYSSVFLSLALALIAL